MLRDPVDRAISSYWFKQPGEHGGSAANLHASMMDEIGRRGAYEACLVATLQQKGKEEDTSGQEEASHNNAVRSGEFRQDAHTQQSRHRFRLAWTTSLWERLLPVEKRRVEATCFARTMTSSGHRAGAHGAESYMRGSSPRSGDVRDTAAVSSYTESETTAPHRIQIHRPVTFGERAKGGAILRNDDLMVHHVNKGVYVEQLQRWFEIFARDMFLVFTLEHFLNDAVAVYHDVCYFMNVRAYGSHQLKKRYNEGTNPHRRFKGW